jgi:hypothetical protein
MGDGEALRMAPTLPDGVDESRGRPGYPDAGVWVRRVVVTALGVFAVLGIVNTFGQSPTVSLAQSRSASLRVTAPADVRGGLIFQVRVEIFAHRRLAKPVLVFSPAWFESMTLNSLAPQPATETSRSGDPAFVLAPIAAGRHATYWFYFQVNPTNVGWDRAEHLQLREGGTPLAAVHRTITIYP